LLENEVSQQPEITVVIPAYNEESYLPGCLASLKRQDYAGKFEIIVVDNNSTDRTAEVARAFGARVFLETARGPASARQRGAGESLGNIIAFIDADTTAPVTWLSQIVRHFQKHPRTVVVSGPYAFQDTHLPGRIFSHLFSFVCISLDHYFRKTCRKGGALWGSNFAVRRNAFQKVGGFDTDIPFYGEDYDLSLRLKDIGGADLLPFLFVATSARRVRRLGVITQYWNWIINYFSVLFHRHPISSDLENLPSRAWQKLTGRLNKSYLIAATGFTGALVILIPLHHIFHPGPIMWLLYALYIAGLAAFLIYHSVSPSSKFFGTVYSHGHRQNKLIALTFDDGPHASATPEVLAILAQTGVRATFFVTGQRAVRHPALCREITSRGHIIGNHSLNHDKWLFLRRPKVMKKEITAAQQIITDAAGTTPELFRPPHGFRSPLLMKTLRENGYTVITWDNMTDDWHAGKTARSIFKDIMKKAGPGSIIVLHDGRSSYEEYDRRNMLAALPQIIYQLKAEGFRFVTVPEILQPPDIS